VKASGKECLWTIHGCLYQNVLYSSFLECLNASDMVMSDHDFYEHKGGGANLVLADRSLT
jgi:hypothetical protein